VYSCDSAVHPGPAERLLQGVAASVATKTRTNSRTHVLIATDGMSARVNQKLCKLMIEVTGVMLSLT
jgi:hypothetical protein